MRETEQALHITFLMSDDLLRDRLDVAGPVEGILGEIRTRLLKLSDAMDREGVSRGGIYRVALTYTPPTAPEALPPSAPPAGEMADIEMLLVAVEESYLSWANWLRDGAPAGENVKRHQRYVAARSALLSAMRAKP